MSFFGIGIHVIIALFFAVHVVRTNQNMYWLLLLFAFGLPVTLMKPNFEFKAIVWHCRHGNSIAVNGVKFPVYFWYAPDNTRDRYHVFDQPGPLRPTNDTFTMFTIDGLRDQTDVGTPQELAQRAMRNYGVKGFDERSTFEWKTGSQTLEMHAGT